jgi:hypothetical protein
MITKQIIHHTKTDIVRKCTKCDDEMHQGYVFDGSDYYCTDECLSTVASPQDWEKLHKNDPEYFYWTAWNDDVSHWEFDEDGNYNF